jgi:hypothetical protein
MALTLIQAIDEIRSNLNETYTSFTELMPNQVDRDFSAASNWLNVDYSNFNTTSDLSLVADGADQYCTLPVASAPTTVGVRKTYRLYFDLSSLTSTFTFKDFTGTQTLGTVSAAGNSQFISFEPQTAGGLRIVAGSGTSSGNFDNFSLVETTGSFWSDSELTVWLQEGCQVFSSKSLLTESVGTISPLILTTPYYDSGDETFIDNILKIYAVIYKIGTSYKGLIKIHPKQIGNLALSATTGPPKFYCFFNKKLYLFPLASATEVANGTVDVLYSGITNDITAIADEYQHLPIIYATAKALQKDQKYGQSGALLQQFYQELSFDRGDKYNIRTDTIEDFKLKQTSGARNNAR